MRLSSLRSPWIARKARFCICRNRHFRCHGNPLTFVIPAAPNRQANRSGRAQRSPKSCGYRVGLHCIQPNLPDSSFLCRPKAETRNLLSPRPTRAKSQYKAGSSRLHRRGPTSCDAMLSFIASSQPTLLFRFPIPGFTHLSVRSTARNASCGISTRPTCFIRFLPSFCFSSNFFLRLTSPP